MSFVEQGLMNVAHRDICEIKVDVDSKGIITNTQYISDVWGTRNVDLCPQTGGLDKLKYVLQPELYEYDKKHNILIHWLILPEQETTGLAKKLGIKKH